MTLSSDTTAVIQTCSTVSRPTLLRRKSSLLRLGDNLEGDGVWEGHTLPVRPWTENEDNESQECELVRGFSGISRDDLPAQAKLVAAALPGWSHVHVGSILVEDKSGHGGSKTFKVSGPDATPPVVALHSRNLVTEGKKGGEVEAASEERLEAAARAFARAGVHPQRLAQGGDWFIEQWEGEQPWNDRDEGWDSLTTQEIQEAAQLLARVHTQVPTDWYDKHRAKIIEQNPIFQECPTSSHAWLTACRLQWFKGEEGADPEQVDNAARFYMSAGANAKSDMHPLASRLVSNHGDFHPSNYILTSTGLACVDLEFAHVGLAVHDLAYVHMWLHGPEKRRAFVHAYMLQIMGEEPADEEVEALWFDVECASLRVFHPAKLWKDFFKTKDDKEAKYFFDEYKQLEATEQEVRSDPALRKAALDTGLLRSPAFKAVELELIKVRMKSSQWHLTAQSTLENTTRENIVLCDDEALKGSEFCIRVAASAGLALEVKPGTHLVQLTEADEEDPQQQWYRVGDGIQHVGTGLFLDTEVKYITNERGAAWESTPTILNVRPRDHSDTQRWCFGKGHECGPENSLEDSEGGIVEGFIRHVIDGRVLDVNCWELQSGQGVNVAVANDVDYGQKMSVKGLARATAPAAVTTAVPVGDAVHMADISPPANEAVVDDTEYIIKCSLPTEITDNAVVHGTEYCMQVFEGGKVKCGKIDGSDAQKWKMITAADGLMQLMNVGNGEFLHTETQYVMIHDQSHVWEGNGTALVTKPQDLSEQQKWVLGFGGPPEKRWGHKNQGPVGAWPDDDDLTESAGKCLRHFKDGRVVDVHGWHFSHGGGMGCENSCHGDNKGTSWMFVDANSTNH